MDRLASDNYSNSSATDMANGLRLELVINDPDTIHALLNHQDIPERLRFACAALKVGILAIRQASGALDSRTIQQECETMLLNLRHSFTEQAGEVKTTLGKYFDPASGEFHQRVERLLARDGDLEKAISTHLTGENSALNRTMAVHIGENSPILKHFSLDERVGILGALKEKMQSLLNEHITAQFSLDKPDSAISRFLEKITEKNGGLRSDLAEDLEKVRVEFSLDKEDSALSRLVGQVNSANDKLTREFNLSENDSALSKLSRILEGTRSAINDNLSMDLENSPLRRLSSNLTDMLGQMKESQLKFQMEVGDTLSAFKARREESQRSTTHGVDFEEEVRKYLTALADGLGDTLEAVGNTVGEVSHCKIGDFVLTLGDVTGASGSRVVVEAKESNSYSLDDAFKEIEKARRNRKAECGVFVFSEKAASPGLQPLCRRGRDLVVRWDAENQATDLVLKTAVLVARFLVVEKRADTIGKTGQISEMKESVDTLIASLKGLETIVTSGNTLKNGAEKILHEAEKLKKTHAVELEKLKNNLGSLFRGDASAAD